MKRQLSTSDVSSRFILYLLQCYKMNSLQYHHMVSKGQLKILISLKTPFTLLKHFSLVLLIVTIQLIKTLPIRFKEIQDHKSAEKYKENQWKIMTWKEYSNTITPESKKKKRFFLCMSTLLLPFLSNKVWSFNSSHAIWNLAISPAKFSLFVLLQFYLSSFL